MTSWNNKPARGWRASDGSHDYTAVYRSLLLDCSIPTRVDGLICLSQQLLASFGLERAPGIRIWFYRQN